MSPEATGVSTDTLRHYERKGLLPRVTRTAAGYRRYSAATVERVLLIQRALVVGFSLADLKRVLGVRDRGGAPCGSVRCSRRRAPRRLNQRIEELLALRDELRCSSRSGTGDWRIHQRESERTCSKRLDAGPLSSKPAASGANADGTETMRRQWCVGLRPVRCRIDTIRSESESGLRHHVIQRRCMPASITAQCPAFAKVVPGADRRSVERPPSIIGHAERFCRRPALLLRPKGLTPGWRERSERRFEQSPDPPRDLPRLPAISRNVPM